MTTAQAAEAADIAAELVEIAVVMSLASDCKLPRKFEAIYAGRSQRVLARLKALHEASSPHGDEVSAGVAETTLCVEGLPLVQTGPGGDYTNCTFASQQPPSRVAALVRRLGAFLTPANTGTHIDVKA